MDQLLRRERLLVPLRMRHELAVTALEAPAGYGRSVLLDQALAEGPRRSGDRDLFYRCVPSDAEPGFLAAHLVDACRSHPTGRPSTADGALDAAAVAGALRGAVPARHQVALVIDAVEVSGTAGGSLVSELVRDLPGGVHLVLSGRRLPRVGMARMVASGTGVLLGAGDLAFQPDEVIELLGDRSSRGADPVTEWPVMVGLIRAGHADLAVDYLHDEVLSDVDPAVVRGLAAIAAVDGCADSQLGGVLASVGIGPAATVDAVRRELERLPRVGSPGGCWPDPIWREATRSHLTPEERDLACVAKTRSLVESGGLGEAGALAVRSASPAALAEVVRAGARQPAAPGHLRRPPVVGGVRRPRPGPDRGAMARRHGRPAERRHRRSGGATARGGAAVLRGDG